ncbi:MAG: hypothetical protein Q7S27_00700 [Nanoarchaeota archaeon]|nr:hypothetical protein [Nanoarchaeota archaeon]
MKISKKTKDTYRFMFTFIRGWLFLAGILFGFTIFVYLLTLSLRNSKIFLSYYILGVIISLVLFLGVGLIFINQLLKWYSLSKIKKHPKKNNPEVAVILGYDGFKIIGNLFISTYLGVEYLLRYLGLMNKSFNVFITPSKREFNDLLNNKNIKIFYLVGHGSKRGFVLNRKENIFYSDYANSKIVKNEIHLYHCGHSEGKTLIDYIVKRENREKCHAVNDKIMVISYILKFYDLYKKENEK